MSSSMCLPWSLLADICSTKYEETMNSIQGCQAYSSLCNVANTAVLQCSIAGVPNLVPTATAISDVEALCGEMPDMAGCELCTDATSPASCPDPLYALSVVCLSMWMSDCDHWRNMCPNGVSGLVPFCGGSATSVTSTATATSASVCRGTMLMHFHSGYQGAAFIILNSNIKLFSPTSFARRLCALRRLGTVHGLGLRPHYRRHRRRMLRRGRPPRHPLCCRGRLAPFRRRSASCGLIVEDLFVASGAWRRRAAQRRAGRTDGGDSASGLLGVCEIHKPMT